MLDTTVQDIRRICAHLQYGRTIPEIRASCKEMDDERFFLIYHAAQVLLKFETKDPEEY